MKTRIIAAWRGLALREKIAISLCLAVVIAGVIVHGIIFPMFDEINRLETELPRLREETAIAQRMADQIGMLTKAIGADQPEHYGADDLIHTLDESATAMGINLAITRSSSADGAIEVTGSAPLPKLLSWLEQTRWKEGLAITTMRLTTKPGVADTLSANIILSRR